MKLPSETKTKIKDDDIRTQGFTQRASTLHETNSDCLYKPQMLEERISGTHEV